jgi:phospholipase C
LLVDSSTATTTLFSWRPEGFGSGTQVECNRRRKILKIISRAALGAGYIRNRTAKYARSGISVFPLICGILVVYAGKAMAEIQHKVVLMLVNRSFDHMVGWLQASDYNIDGVDGTQFNRDSTGEPVKVTNDASFSGDYDPDVAHDFVNVTEQIFGTTNPGPGAVPNMSGFVTSYGAVSGSVRKSHRVMKCFKPEKVPVISTLAQQYALCTRWFSSVPGPTHPNRAYAHGGTSVGHVDMTVNWWKESKTIYELLAAHNFTAKIYYTDSTITLTYGGMLAQQDRYFVPDIQQFYRDCKKNNLPNYSFLEPRYNASSGTNPMAASDQHPDHDVSEGEQLILDVYNAIRSNSDTWNTTLLAIVYDEHGGLYDHVPPPAAVSPDGINSASPFFAFDRLGVRVPTVLVSPYIEPGTIVDDTVFDHTSLISTARKVFIKQGWEDTFLTQRDKAAETFEWVLTRATPRDRKTVADPTHFHKLQMAAHSENAATRAIRQAGKPLTEHQQALTTVMASARASTMTQDQAASLNAEIKGAVHGSGTGKGAGS